MQTDKAMIDALKAVAHLARYEILEALADGELNVGEIQQATSTSQPALSQQLAHLRKFELVTTRRESKLVYYSINNERIGELIEMLSRLTSVDLPPAPGRRRNEHGAAKFARLLNT